MYCHPQGPLVAAISRSRSVLESEEGGHASLDPLSLRFVGRQLEVEHEVGRVTRGRECAITREDLVDWALIEASLRDFTVLHRHEVNHGHLDEELLRFTLVEHLYVVVPPTALQVQAVGVASSFRLRCHVLPA